MYTELTFKPATIQKQLKDQPKEIKNDKDEIKKQHRLQKNPPFDYAFSVLNE